MSFYIVDGADLSADVTGEYELPSASLEPIPDGSSVLAIIDEAKWEHDNNGVYFVSLRWSVLQPDSFKNRKVFQKLYIEDHDPRAKDAETGKRKKIRTVKMFLAIDANAGGGLARLGKKPTNDDLMLHLCNKPMVIRVGVWAMTGERGDEMSGNWVQAVAGANKPLNITDAKPPKARPASGGGSGGSGGARSGAMAGITPGGAGGGFASEFDDDIPF